MLCHFPPLYLILFFLVTNLPEINWSSLNPRCPTADSLLNLTSRTFLNQQVSEPTRNCNILDLIFCPDNIRNFITVSDTFLSDHRVIYAEILIPVYDSSTVQIDQNLTPSPSTRIEIWTLISKIGQNSRSLLILLIGPLHFVEHR